MIVNHSKTRRVPWFPYCICWQDDVIQSVRQGRILWMTSSCQETEKGNRKHLQQNAVQICPVSCQSVGVRASVSTKSTKSELGINKGLARQGLKNVLFRYHWWMSASVLIYGRISWIKLAVDFDDIFQRIIWMSYIWCAFISGQIVNIRMIICARALSGVITPDNCCYTKRISFCYGEMINCM